jgi:hypothetical protein
MLQWGRVKASINEAEAWATLTEREAQEKVLKTEAESAASLAYVNTKAIEFARMVALLEGELDDACRARDTTEVNFQGLSDKSTDVNW